MKRNLLKKMLTTLTLSLCAVLALQSMPITANAETENEFGRLPPNHGSKNDTLYDW